MFVVAGPVGRLSNLAGAHKRAPGLVSRVHWRRAQRARPGVPISVRELW